VRSCSWIRPSDAARVVFVEKGPVQVSAVASIPGSGSALAGPSPADDYGVRPLWSARIRPSVTGVRVGAGQEVPFSPWRMAWGAQAGPVMREGPSVGGFRWLKIFGSRSTRNATADSAALDCCRACHCLP